MAVFFIVLFTAEAIYATAKNSASRFQTLVEGTVAAEDRMITIRQDLSKYPDAKPLSLSINERTGIEFAYTFFMFVSPSTFSGDTNFKHVFHKGYAEPWPLIGPGVFMHGNENTMRVVMSTYKNPYTYTDVKNIPVEKWCHVVLNCYKGGLDVFVNGHLASRISFADTLPYQNFQDVHLFSTQNNTTIQGPSIAVLDGQQFHLGGAFKGYLSNLMYARYALSASEIQAILKKGPTEKMRQVVMDKPPYFADNWWASQA